MNNPFEKKKEESKPVPEKITTASKLNSEPVPQKVEEKKPNPFEAMQKKKLEEKVAAPVKRPESA